MTDMEAAAPIAQQSDRAISQTPSTTDPGARATPLPLAAMLVACLGLFAAGVLSIGHFLHLPVPCGESKGCLTVAMHPSSQVLGVPIAYFGVAAYLALIVLLVLAPSTWARRAAVAVAAVGALSSLALSFYSVTVIRATCAWCLASATAMSLLLLLTVALARSRRVLRPLSGSTALSLVFLVIAALALQARSMQRAALAPPISAERLAQVPARELVNTANALGPRSAPVTIVMFSDMWCPSCREIEPALSRYQKANPSRVRFVYRHLPLMNIPGHQFSGTAAALSEIAAERGLFWSFKERLHRQRTQLDANGYIALMSALGFEPSAVKARMDDPKNTAAARVQRDITLAERLGIRSTPTFLVLVEGQSPVSSSQRGLTALLNSPSVQSKLASTAQPDRP
jgi:protein-disulfide isomerase